MFTRTPVRIWSTVAWTRTAAARKVSTTPSAQIRRRFLAKGFLSINEVTFTPSDMNIVPYNRELFLDWGCGHTNVEFSGQTYTVLYLYKYLSKGPSKIAVTLEQANQANSVLELHKHDEVGRTVSSRTKAMFDGCNVASFRF